MNDYEIVPKNEVTKKVPFGLQKFYNRPRMTEEEPKYVPRKKTVEKIKAKTNKVLDKLYLSSTKPMMELLEETSLDGFRVVKLGDPVKTTLGVGVVKKILNNGSKVQYGVLLNNSLSRIYKSGSLVYFFGRDLSAV